MTLTKQISQGNKNYLNITNIKLSVRFNKTREMLPSVTRVLSILLTSTVKCKKREL